MRSLYLTSNPQSRKVPRAATLSLARELLFLLCSLIAKSVASHGERKAEDPLIVPMATTLRSIYVA